VQKIRYSFSWQDLSKLNRDPAKVLYLSGHALENCLQQENAVPIKPWKKDDANDTALLDFIPFLEGKHSSVSVV
jgi:import inner membrane translocase subunit TIM50